MPRRVAPQLLPQVHPEVPVYIEYIGVPLNLHRRSRNAGVKSKMPTAGSRWRFDQLLVVDGKADLEIVA